MTRVVLYGLVQSSRVLLTDIAFGESPRWHDGRLWFSDWVAKEVVAVDLDGRREVILEVDALPFSIDWLGDGRLLVAGPGLLRRERDGSLVAHADLGGLSEGWNEIVVDGRDRAYVNAPGFNMMAGEPPAPGIVAVATLDGTARQVAGDVAFPNGMAVTADDSTLIVAESYANRLTAFEIGADGGLSNRRVWAELGDGVPDGICIDAEGAVWCADVPNKRCVRVAEGGEVLETIELDRGCFACMLGGEDGSTLFIMAQEWKGPQGMADGSRTGRVVAVDAPAPRAGRP
jgi:sugar lactone lactonase YvrE